MKIKAFVERVRFDLTLLPKQQQFPESSLSHVIDATSATQKLMDTLEYLERNRPNEDANATTLKGLLSLIQERSLAVGENYVSEPDRQANRLFSVVAKNLSNVVKGIRAKEILGENVKPKVTLISSQLEAKDPYFYFDEVVKSLQTKDNLLQLMQTQLKTQQWEAFLKKMSLSKLTGLLLNVQGDELKTLMRRDNYFTLMPRLEAAMAERSHYKADDAKHNAAMSFCIAEAYDRHRSLQGDYTSGFMGYPLGTEKTQKLALVRKAKQLLSEGNDIKSVAEKLRAPEVKEGEADVSIAAKDGFMSRFVAHMEAVSNPAYFAAPTSWFSFGSSASS